MTPSMISVGRNTGDLPVGGFYISFIAQLFFLLRDPFASDYDILVAIMQKFFFFIT